MLKKLQSNSNHLKWFSAKLNIKNSISLRLIYLNNYKNTLYIDPWEKGIEDAYLNRPGERTSRETYDYTRNFVRDRSDDNWVPHITLGWEDINSVEVESTDFIASFPMKFRVNEIALCRLGNHNTCRRLLKKWELRS